MIMPLSPLSFLERSASVHADRIAVVDGARRYTYAEFEEFCRRLATVLMEDGIRDGARVAVLCPNDATMLAAHFAVPLAGGVLVTLNTRLSSDEIAYVLDHSGASLLLHDPEYDGVVRDAIERMSRRPACRATGPGTGALDATLAAATPAVGCAALPEDALLAVNYTSGTTARPKGVEYRHRGAYLQALAMAYHLRLEADSRYLWTLPMFHCNGWCLTWAVTAAGGRHVCLRGVDVDVVWRELSDGGVTHLCGAPAVVSMILDAAAARPLTERVRFATGGAAPSPTMLQRAEQLGFEVTHLYGLTETYGPAVICDWRRAWDALPRAERARFKARQGVPNVLGGSLRVMAADGRAVRRDGVDQGEIQLRGHNVTTGYFQDENATASAFVDGWFRTGDVGVLHADGYVEVRDRSKDVIISGGENISSIEVENALSMHPAVAAAAVVAAADAKWGEVPVAFVSLRAGADPVTAEELRAHVRTRLAGFKVPKRIVFGDLPRTSTGKVRKQVLRQRLER